MLPTASPSPAPEIDFGNVVVPITDVKPDFRLNLLRGLAPEIGIKSAFGTGFCLDPECSVIATNYHVAAMARPKKIKGDPVVSRYLDSGSEDNHATLNMVYGQPMIYSVKRDLALFVLWKPLRHHHGLAYSTDDLEIGEPVDIYTYPLEGMHAFRTPLRFPGTFQGPVPSGLLVFSYQPIAGKRIAGGASGGIVVDRKGSRIVGILSAVGNSKSPFVEAVPTQSLVDFVSKVQPFLAHRIFPPSTDVPSSPFTGDSFPEWIPPRTDALQRRTEEPDEIKLLRNKAQAAADAMRNMIAVGSFDWGSGKSDPVVVGEEYEIRVIDGGTAVPQVSRRKEGAEGTPYTAFRQRRQRISRG